MHAKANHHGPAKVSDPTILLRFHAKSIEGVPDLHYLVPQPNRLNEKIFEAEFWKMIPIGTNGGDLPTTFVFERAEPVLGVRWPRLECELMLVRQLLSISAGWTISVLTSTASALEARHATEATLVPHEDLLKAAELKKQAAAVKKALDQTIGSGPAGEKYKKKGKATGKGRGRGKARGQLQPPSE